MKVTFRGKQYEIELTDGAVVADGNLLAHGDKLMPGVEVVPEPISEPEIEGVPV